MHRDEIQQTRNAHKLFVLRNRILFSASVLLSEGNNFKTLNIVNSEVRLVLHIGYIKSGLRLMNSW